MKPKKHKVLRITEADYMLANRRAARMKKVFSLFLLPGILHCSAASAQEDGNIPQPVPMEQVRAKGELLLRLDRNFDRMESEHYRTDHVFLTEEQSGGWSGDTEGRTILALVMDSRATGRAPVYLDGILQRLPEELNGRGYLGPDFFPSVSEQQLGGNCWLLNGLSEHYLWKGEPSTLIPLRSVAEGLYVASRGHFTHYPADPSLRDTGGPAGTIMAHHDGWMLSSDVGAGLACLDGMVQAYDVLRLPGLKGSIDAAIEAFRGIDPVKIQAHTHPYTLIMMGLLRYAGITGDESLVEWVKDLWDIYLLHGMSENYGCYNWLDRFDTWTEPCAIVDSYITATQLWRCTGDPRYRDMAELIYFNALTYSQHTNGGFGLENCPGEASGTHFLKPVGDEAWWCCSMRGAEGLARASQYTWFTQGDDVIVGTLRPSTLTLPDPKDGSLTVDMETGYPLLGGTVLRLGGESRRKVSLLLPAPAWTEKAALRVNGRRIRAYTKDGFVRTGPVSSGDVVEYSFKVKDWYDGPQTPSNNPGGIFRVLHGPLLLCADEDVTFPKGSRLEQLGGDVFRVKGKGVFLHPLRHVMDPGFRVDRADDCARKILFEELK